MSCSTIWEFVVAWCLSNLVRMKPIPHTRYLLQALPAFVSFIHSNNEEVLTDTCWALSYIAESFECVYLMKENPSFIRRLVELATKSSTLSVLVPSIRAFGNILLEDDSEEIVLNSGFLDYTINLLTHPKRAVQREMLWILSNIVSGSVKCCERIISDPDIFHLVFKLLSTSHENVVTDGLYMVANFSASADSSHLLKFVEQGFFTKLVELYGRIAQFATTTRVQFVVGILNCIQKYQKENTGVDLIMITNSLIRDTKWCASFIKDVIESSSLVEIQEQFSAEVKALLEGSAATTTSNQDQQQQTTQQE